MHSQDLRTRHVLKVSLLVCAVASFLACLLVIHYMCINIYIYIIISILYLYIHNVFLCLCVLLLV